MYFLNHQACCTDAEIHAKGAPTKSCGTEHGQLVSRLTICTSSIIFNNILINYDAQMLVEKIRLINIEFLIFKLWIIKKLSIVLLIRGYFRLFQLLFIYFALMIHHRIQETQFRRNWAFIVHYIYFSVANNFKKNFWEAEFWIFMSCELQSSKFAELIN